MKLTNDIVFYCTAALACLCALGCDAKIDRFEPNVIFAKRFELSEGVAMEQALEDASTVVTDLFGTPDEPRWPDYLGDKLVDIERLKRAAGPQYSDEAGIHFGLFREHCVVCHGITGDGLGPAASLLTPYPRDLRHGRYKFKSTEMGEKPTRQDLMRVLRHGIVGTSMPAFRLVEESDLEALVDYVIYLSVRGELERKLLAKAGMELDVEGGERLYDPRLENVDPKAFTKAQNEIEEALTDIVGAWDRAESTEVSVPSEFPFVGSGADVEAIAASVEEGKTLFQGTIAACAICHGPDATGDGQQNNFDDWTRDWTTMAGINPNDHRELEPMIALGALKPKVLPPRNLQLGAFRGGSKPEDLYRRIVNGIEGTPMPAIPLKSNNPQGLTEEQVWSIVNYLLSLQPNREGEPA